GPPPPGVRSGPPGRWPVPGPGDPARRRSAPPARPSRRGPAEPLPVSPRQPGWTVPARPPSPPQDDDSSFSPSSVRSRPPRPNHRLDAMKLHDVPDNDAVTVLLLSTVPRSHEGSGSRRGSAHRPQTGAFADRQGGADEPVSRRASASPPRP